MIPTYVLVHPSGSNSRVWATVQREMAFRGHRTLAVDLPGRGTGFTRAYQTQDLAAFAAEPSPIAHVTGRQWVGHVVDTVRRIRDHGPVILVGHSLGGLMITGVANEIPGLLARVVYIAAQCPVTLAPGDYIAEPEWASSTLFPATAKITMTDPAERRYIRLNWRTNDPAAFDALRDALGGGASPDTFVAALNGFEPDEVWWQTNPTFDIRVGKDSWGRVPHSFIRLTEDKNMPPAAQERYIQEADALTPHNPFDVHFASGGHGTFLHRPAEVVDILSGFGE
ncbi:alpha/beta hydrolase [Kibdelosporangium persicum]|uniref:Pimeloyl-ACP methyl ester carboxylesterase n=1 Tax=Kibdelosporangium persicum TaxID=2698649 RepID=A0ABX2EZB2_9PSEU|nr:alpha/beta hydrolase [Kibdelosporangium persicum]NRN64229.1 Pimeloyl-ACP methyl ester carboxylesterase [Kibdelosporangium persicum]